MGVMMVGGLERSEYWQGVCVLANELLVESPLRDWAIIVGQATAVAVDARCDEAGWQSKADREATELSVGVPCGVDYADECDPEDAATYIVFDLLHEAVFGDEGGNEHAA